MISVIKVPYPSRVKDDRRPSSQSYRSVFCQVVHASTMKRTIRWVATMPAAVRARRVVGFGKRSVDLQKLPLFVVVGDVDGGLLDDGMQ